MREFHQRGKKLQKLISWNILLKMIIKSQLEGCKNEVHNNFHKWGFYIFFQNSQVKLTFPFTDQPSAGSTTC